jgi:uncharacterized SAM-binding protein YcdF (DUF218 family)
MNTFYIASKLFTYLVLPPGIFIVLFLLASFYAKKYKFIFLLGALSFYALSNSYVADWLLSPLEKPYKSTLQTDKNVDAVVILSGGSIEGSPNIPISSSAYKRAIWGLMVAKTNNLPVLFSGAGLNQRYSEADAFVDSINELKENLHVAVAFSNKFEPNNFSIYIENKSLDTFENAKISKQIFEEEGIKNPKIYLVTSAFHMKRSIKLYEYFGFEVIPSATDFRLSQKERTKWDYLPNIEAFYNSYTALHEYFGILSLLLKGIY